MQFFRRIAKPVSYVVVVGVVVLGVYIPSANAGIVSTNTVLKAQQMQHDRQHLRDTLARQDVQQLLLERGVSPQTVQARVDSLSDEEVQSLQTKVDELPAGGDALGVAVFVFLVLLVTDILGYTDIFPFVKKPRRR